jgi:hypothetical protein
MLSALKKIEDVSQQSGTDVLPPDRRVMRAFCYHGLQHTWPIVLVQYLVLSLHSEGVAAKLNRLLGDTPVGQSGPLQLHMTRSLQDS